MYHVDTVNILCLRPVSFYREVIIKDKMKLIFQNIGTVKTGMVTNSDNYN